MSVVWSTLRAITEWSTTSTKFRIRKSPSEAWKSRSGICGMNSVKTINRDKNSVY